MNNHPDRPGQRHREGCSEVVRGEIEWGDDTGVASLFSQARCSTLQQDGRIGLWQEDDQGQSEQGDDEAEPECPPPAHGRDESRGPRGDDGAKRGTLPCERRNAGKGKGRLQP